MSVDEQDGAERRLGRRKALGVELRQAFGQVAEEPVPAPLEELARRLDQSLRAVDGGDAQASEEVGDPDGPPPRSPVADA